MWETPRVFIVSPQTATNTYESPRMSPGESLLFNQADSGTHQVAEEGPRRIPSDIVLGVGFVKTTPILLLDDDALFAIFSYIHGEAALNAALTCRRLRPFALRRVAARAKCSESGFLDRLCRYMLEPQESQSNELRAAHLQMLVINKRGFSGGDDSIIVQQSVRMAKLLSKSRGLRELQCFLLSNDPADTILLRALPSLCCLSVLELSAVNDNAVSVLASITTLTSLTLHYHIPERSMTGGATPKPKHTLRTLIITLCRLPRLHNLELFLFTPSDANLTWSLDGFRSTSPPRLRSIAGLVFCKTSESALMLVALCPNISSLTISKVASRSFPPAGHTDTAVTGVSARHNGWPRWPPLTNLSLSKFDLECIALDRFKTAQRVNLLDPSFERILEVARAPLTRAFHTLAPTLLAVTSTLDEESWKLWQDLPSYAPTLRLLDLAVHPPGVNPWSDIWPGCVAGCVRTLPLLGFRLIMHAPVYSNQARHEEEWAMIVGDRVRLMRATYRRPEIVNTLPRQLFKVIPTLRIVAIAEEEAQSGGAIAARCEGKYEYERRGAPSAGISVYGAGADA
ncbi:hypothetical protein C8Q79DRAFT_521002 [Trametes meyenii]|nr:hypothetical protein C8Q79DRAFT_521002 [Trametes meyenii]